ncbi:MDR family MFS transporter [Laceyella sacchari]|jgi:EmrB/QacA subfamily drug resistance transporter|uniref:MFS transporter n=1 Tax=Laceyella sacchari TaxID=37482 RepID=A0ABY5U2T1_LACSH|nr:MDR family MFS transporter [Laceyella sacchari]UWE03325.1 MFS transporter [Laceyella sacchari]
MEYLSQRKKLIVMLAIMSALFFASLNQTIIGTALPTIVAQLGGADYFDWVFTINMLASAITVIIVGKLSDIYGRRSFLLYGLGVLILGCVLCGTAKTMFQLILYRGVQGIGEGMVMSTVFTSVGDLFAPRERGKWQGMLGATFGLTSILGPSIGGFIVHHWSWPWIFWVFLPVGIISLFLILSLYPKTDFHQREAVDYWGAFALIAMMLPMMFALSFGGKAYAWTSPLILSLLGMTILSFSVFLIIESKVESPMVPLNLFKNSIFTLSNIVSFGIGIGMFGTIMYIPFLAQGVLGTDSSKTGMIMMSLIISMMVFSTISGQIVSKTGKYKVLSIFGLVTMTGASYLLYLSDPSTTPLTLVSKLVLFGIGLGICFPIFSLTAQNALEHRYLGVATSTNQLFRQLGGTVGVAIMGTIMSTQLNEKLTHIPLLDKITNSRVQLDGSHYESTLKALLDPQKLGEIRAHLPSAQMAQFDHLVMELRHTIDEAIGGIFLFIMLSLLVCVVLSFFIKEIELRTVNTPESAENTETNSTSTA